LLFGFNVSQLHAEIIQIIDDSFIFTSLEWRVVGFLKKHFVLFNFTRTTARKKPFLTPMAFLK